MSTTVIREDEQQLEQFGYRPQFARTLRSFESFAVGYSFISITTGIFTTFGFLLTTAGPRGIWTWPIAIGGQALVAMVYAAFAARIPVAGYSYQWASRLTNPAVGWWYGWLSFAFLSIVTVSVDYAFVGQAFQPLLGLVPTPTSTAWLTVAVLVVQASLIVASTRVTARVNNASVVTELVGIVELSIVLLAAALLASNGHWSNLGSTGIVPAAGWFRWLGPFMLATLLGAYTIVGFESSANLAEETRDPQRVVPRAMVRAVLMSGVIGGVFLIALAVAATDLQGASRDAAPVAFILKGALGNSIERVFLLFICVSIFACGLIIMVTNTRLIWAMARDRRLPGHQLLAQVPRPTGGPTWSTALAAATSAAIVLVLQHNATALLTLFTASTIMPAILYAGTVLLYVAVARKLQPEPGRFHLGRWERAVVLGALAWLAYELVILLGPAQFRSAQLYAVGAVALGVVVYGLMWLLEPAAMRWQPGVAEEPAAPAPAADPAAAGPPPDLLGSQSQPWLPPPAAAQWPPTWAAQPAPSSSPPSPPQAPQWPPEWATPTAPQQWQQPRMAQQARTAAPQWPPSAQPSPDFGGRARMVTRITFKRDAVLAGQPLPPLPGATVDASGSTVIVDTDYPTGAVLSLARWAAEAGYRELPELTIAPAGFGAGEPRPAPADEHEFAARPRRMRW